MRWIDRLRPACVLAAGLLVLAGCGKGDTVEAGNESVQSVAAKVAKSDVRPAPGRWESQFRIVAVDMPGMPPEMQGMMKEQLGKAQTSVSCLTREEAERAEKEFFKPPETAGDECTYNTFRMGGGSIEADMTCKDKDNTQNMRMTGTYGSDAYAMKVVADGSMGPQKVSMTMEIDAKRVGECDGSETG
ncbi:MAG: DUF3617 family protein [Novosphingobium sp.]|nr:DUF3617 family protein [Novosphingobium sp.]